MEFARDTRRATLRSALANICVAACWIYRWKFPNNEVLRRQYRHLWEAVRSFQPEFVDAEMKRRQGLAAEVSTLV